MASVTHMNNLGDALNGTAMAKSVSTHTVFSVRHAGKQGVCVGSVGSLTTIECVTHPKNDVL